LRHRHHDLISPQRATDRAFHPPLARARPLATRGATSPTQSTEFFYSRRVKLLHLAFESLISRVPYFARACGRVSIGGVRTRGRTAAYGRESFFLARCPSRDADAIGSRRRNRRCPFSTGDAA
jgi:hypothetical protein